MLRQGHPQDMDEITEIWLLASLQAHDFVDASCWWRTQEALRTRYLEHARIWVFEQQDHLLGFIALVDDYLAALYVRPEWQGQGVGHALLQQAKLQQPSLYARVFMENAQALRFYRRNGFVIVAEEPEPLTGHSQYRICYGSPPTGWPLAMTDTPG